MAVESFVDVLRARNESDPGRCVYSFLMDGEREEVKLTWHALWRSAVRIAALLRAHAAVQEPVLLIFEPGLGFIEAFFGCLWAGVIAVPAFPPSPGRPTFDRLQSMAADSGARIVLTSSALEPLRSLLELVGTPLAACRWLSIEDAPEHEAEPASISGDAVALLQYTSGSTGDPRGVMVTHANLIRNSQAIQRGFLHGEALRGLIWLPPYHDMGLIGGILQPAFVGGEVTLMSPLHFMQRPMRWLEAVSRLRATTSGAPNFAFELCARRAKPEQVLALDLSSWQVAFCGAEPIRVETLDLFARTFAPAGFRSEALCPCYGLAESTLIVSARGVPRAPTVFAASPSGLAAKRLELAGDDEQPRALVGCGAVVEGDVLVVDPETLVPVGPTSIGEVWLRGPSVARGYWRREAESGNTFGAHTADGVGPWLRSGDLGALHDGELYVVGRIKELIIIAGRNAYPQDIEATVERCHPAVRAGRCVAFSTDRAGEEVLTVALEPNLRKTSVTLADLAAAVRRAVSLEHGIRVDAVVLLAHGSIPMTPSGKLRRNACRMALQGGELQPTARL